MWHCLYSQSYRVLIYMYIFLDTNQAWWGDFLPIQECSYVPSKFIRIHLSHSLKFNSSKVGKPFRRFHTFWPSNHLQLLSLTTNGLFIFVRKKTRPCTYWVFTVSMMGLYAKEFTTLNKKKLFCQTLPSFNQKSI